MLVHVWDTPLVSRFIDTLWATVYPGGGACVRKLKVTALPLIVHRRLLPKRLNISSEKTSPYQQLQRFFFLSVYVEYQPTIQQMYTLLL